MRRTYATALWALLAAGIYSGIVGINALITKPTSVYDQNSVTRPADLAPGGMESAVLVFGAGLVLLRLSVICRWIRQTMVAAADARQHAQDRREAEDRLLEDYGHGAVRERRTGHMLVRPDAVANRAA